jgi:two-component system, NtrC family, sensor kinase
LRRRHEELARTNAELKEARALADQLNAELEVKVGQLERSNRDLRDFAHVAAHDLQEPLRKIEAFGGRLASRYGDRLPEDGRMFIERMNDASGRMRRLITDLLGYARLNKNEAPFEPVDLRSVVRGVLSDLQVRIEETGADVRVGDLPTIDANPAQMRQLMQNLVANALKFRKPGTPPVVRIEAEIFNANDSAPHVRLTVSDNGIGFDNASAGKLFQLFHRLHGRSEYDGTGVGLATCRRIADNHAGTITASGILGMGAAFEVTLPVRKAVAA